MSKDKGRKEAKKWNEFAVIPEVANCSGTRSDLERGDLPLEKSLELFEQGIGLSRQCQERLSQAERRIEVLLRDNQGRPVVSAFEDAKMISKENGTENDENVF